MVLTVSFVLFPVTGLCLPPSSADRSTNLMPASGHQNHTTSPSASAPFVSAAFASTASRTYVRDDRDTPLMWDAMARYNFDLGQTGNGMFLQLGLDRANQIDPVQQIRFLKNSASASLWIIPSP